MEAVVIVIFLSQISQNYLYISDYLKDNKHAKN